MSTTVRKTVFVLVPVEVEVASYVEDEPPHISSIRSPNDREIRDALHGGHSYQDRNAAHVAIVEGVQKHSIATRFYLTKR